MQQVGRKVRAMQEKGATRVTTDFGGKKRVQKGRQEEGGRGGALVFFMQQVLPVWGGVQGKQGEGQQKAKGTETI